MASVVRSRSGRWEVRESLSTSAGPRSRTLASFAELTPAVIELALARASTRFCAADLRRAALRAGAPLAPAPADHAAIELLVAIRAGGRPRPGLALVLADVLPVTVEGPSDAVRSAGAWLGASTAERGAALRDLLLLVDRLPPRRRAPRSSFPRMDSG